MLRYGQTLVVVIAFEFQSIIEDDFQALCPACVVAYVHAIEFAHQMFVADGMFAAGEAKIGRPVIVDGNARVAGQSPIAVVASAPRLR